MRAEMHAMASKEKRPGSVLMSSELCAMENYGLTIRMLKGWWWK